MLEDLTKTKPSDPEAFRLLGEVKFEMKDYEGSAAAFRSSAMMSNKVDFDVLRGLTNALLAAKKPDEAVQILLTSRNNLEKKRQIRLIHSLKLTLFKLNYFLEKHTQIGAMSAMLCLCMINSSLATRMIFGVT